MSKDKNTNDYIRLLECRVRGYSEAIEDQQQKIEQLEKEVERLRVDNYHLENNMKISEERVKELEGESEQLVSNCSCISRDTLTPEARKMFDDIDKALERKK